jgi:hypothetical protein
MGLAFESSRVSASIYSEIAQFAQAGANWVEMREKTG